MKKSILGLFLIGIVLATTGAICSQSGKMPETIELEYWSPEHEADNIEEIINEFTTLYPYVKINYTKFTYDEYENLLISSWAKNQGPDIFSIPNSYVKKYYDYISPEPSSVKVTTVEQKKKYGKEDILIQQINQKTITPEELKNQFIDTVYSDVVFDYTPEDEKTAVKKIFGVPLAADTLALYYNKDLLNQASISLPASDWQTVVDHTKEITKIDKEGNIIQSGIALGGSENVPNYFDIISALMMQFGSNMTSNSGFVTFSEDLKEDAGRRNSSQEALDFYAKFGQEEWETYTWNNNINDALDAFVNNKLAYFIGYHYHLDQIKQLNSNLNFDVAALPQITPSDQINYPNYWVESVSLNTKSKDMSWAFINYLTSSEKTQQYLEKAHKPAARKELINSQLEDYELAVFANQGLTAKSWYHGQDPQEAKNIFKQMIDKAIAAQFTLDEIVSDAANKVQLTY